MVQRTILFVLPHLRAGGVEFVVRELVNQLDRSHWRPVLCLASASGDLLSEVATDVSVIDNNGARSMAMIPRLPAIINHENVDLIYVGTNAMNIAVLSALQMIPRSRRPQVIVTEHTSAKAYLSKSRFQTLRTRMMRWLYPKADLLAFPMQSLAREWCDAIGAQNIRTVQLDNPVLDRTSFEQLWHCGYQAIPKRIVAAGRLVKDKGHDVLLHAMAEVKKTHPEATLDIFGNGPEDAYLRALISQLGLTTTVNLRGFSRDLPQEFSTAHTVVLPSRREGFGNVVIEALAAGTPVIATQCPGPRAILQDGKLGTLVPIDDPSALAQALSTRLFHPPDKTDKHAIEKTLAPYFTDTAVAKFDHIAQAMFTKRMAFS